MEGRQKEILIPEELLENVNQDLALSLYIVLVNKQTFLTTVDRSVMFKATVPIKTMDEDDLWKVLDFFLRHYNDAANNIVRIHMDREFFLS